MQFKCCGVNQTADFNLNAIDWDEGYLIKGETQKRNATLAPISCCKDIIANPDQFPNNVDTVDHAKVKACFPQETKKMYTKVRRARDIKNIYVHTVKVLHLQNTSSINQFWHLPVSALFWVYIFLPP